MEFSHLNYDVVDSIAEISLQRPPVNALNLEMIREIVDAVNRAAEDPKVRAVSLRRMFLDGSAPGSISI